MAQTRRHDRATGVMFLDLDRFKLTNDTFGHSAGDQLLKHVGARLADCVREGDTVGRFGGDEFGIVLADMRTPEDARLVAQKILDVLQVPFELEGHEVFITTSIGISLYPADSDDDMELMKNADTAMYRAKESGRNKYEFFSKDMNARSAQRLNLENNLRGHSSVASSCCITSPRRASRHGRSPASKRCCAGRRAGRSSFHRPNSCRCSRTPG
jgi:diguanylate cyclase (GGDEF)-like protein